MKQIQSGEIFDNIGQPFAVICEGDISNNRCQVQRKRADGDIWTLCYEFKPYDQTVILASIEGMVYRAVSQSSGVEFYVSKSYVSRDPLANARR